METLVVVLWFVACGVALLLLPLVWRMSAEQAARGGPLVKRAVVPRVAAAIVLGLAFVLVPNWAALALGVVFVLLVGFAIYVDRSGRPEFLVPPPLRAERVPEHGERVA